MRKNVWAVLAAIFHTACVGPGAVTTIPVTIEGKRATIIAHNQWAPDSWIDRDQMALNYVVLGHINEKQILAVAETERACRIYTGVVHPGNLVAVVSDGILYATYGFLGFGIASQVIAGAKAVEGAIGGAAITGSAGAARSTVSLGNRIYTFENCGREVIALFPEYGVRIIQKR